MKTASTIARVSGLLLGAALPMAVLAGSITLPNPVQGGTTDLFGFIKLIFDNVILPFGSIAVALGIIWSGFQLVMAQGKPEGISKARTSFFWTFIGGLVLLGSWAIATAIASTVTAIRTGI